MEKLDLNLEPANSIIFKNQQQEIIIVIDSKGFIYKGELIEDAGEVYMLFKCYLEQSLIK